MTLSSTAAVTCKLLRLLPDKHMVEMIVKLIQNRIFTLTTGDSKQSRLRRLKNNFPQQSVLVLLLFNTYTNNLSFTVSRKVAYAHDLALLHFSENRKDLKETLSQDMTIVSAYLHTYRLKLNHVKTVTAAYCLNNRKAKRKLNVYNSNRIVPFCPTPYVGIKLDRSFTFCHHLVALRKNIFACHNAEATCRLRMGCWCQNTAHSCPILGLLNSCVLRTSRVSQRSHSPHRQILK